MWVLGVLGVQVALIINRGMVEQVAGHTAGGGCKMTNSYYVIL